MTGTDSEHKKKLIAFAGLSNISSDIEISRYYKNLQSSNDLIQVLQHIKKTCDETIAKIKS